MLSFPPRWLGSDGISWHDLVESAEYDRATGLTPVYTLSHEGQHVSAIDGAYEQLPSVDSDGRRATCMQLTQQQVEALPDGKIIAKF